MPPLHEDTFDDRTLSGDWGTLSGGGTWSETFAPDCSVTGGYGAVSLPNNGSLVSCYVSGSSVADVDIFRRVTLVGTVPSGAAWTEIRARHGAGTNYVARATFDTSGTLNLGLYRQNGDIQIGSTVDTGLGWVSGTYVWTRFRVSGTSLKVKAWAGTEADEPGTWAIDTTDSNVTAAGQYGLHHQTSAASTKSFRTDYVAFWNPADVGSGSSASKAGTEGPAITEPTTEIVTSGPDDTFGITDTVNALNKVGDVVPTPTDKPVVTARVDWGKSGTFDSGYETISARVAGFDLSTGASADFSSTQTGQLILHVHNHDDFFTPDRNWADNPSFEGGTTGWSTAATVFTAAATSIAQVTDNAPDAGTKAGEVVLPATLNAGVTYAIPYTFRAGVPYSVSIYLKSVSGSTSIQAFLGDTATAAGNSSSGSITTSWAEKTFTWTPAATHSSVVVGVRVTAAAAATVRVDRIQVNPGPSANTYLEGPTRGQLLPGRSVHVYTTYGGVDYPHFSGTLENVRVDPVAKTADLVCQDLFRSMERTLITIPAAQIPRAHSELRATAIQQWAIAAQRTSFSEGSSNLAQDTSSFESGVFGNPSAVQTKTSSSSIDTTSHTVRLDGATGAGSLLVIAVGTREAVTVTVGTDSSPAPVRLGSATTNDAAPAAHVELWHVYPTAGAQRITVTTSAATRIGVIAAEYTGISATFSQAWSGASLSADTGIGGGGSVASSTAEWVIGVEIHENAALLPSSSAGYTDRERLSVTDGGFGMTLQEQFRSPAEETPPSTQFHISPGVWSAFVGAAYPKARPFFANGDAVVGPSIPGRTTSTAKFGSSAYEILPIKPSLLTQSTVSGAGAGFTITKPSGTASGDVLIVGAAAQSDVGSWTPPAGWTLIDSQAGTFPSVAAWYKVAGGSEPADYTFTSGTSARVAAWAGRFVGVSTSTVVNGSAKVASAAGTSVPVASVGTTVNGSLILVFAATDDAGPVAGQLFSPGSEFFSHVASVRSTAGALDANLGVLQGAEETATATGTRTLTYLDTGATSSTSVAFALTPAASVSAGKSGAWLPVGGLFGSQSSAEFDLEQSYSWTAWARSTSGSVTLNFGSESQSRATDSAQTQTADGTYKLFSGTWTPGGVGVVTDVHLRVYNSTGENVQVDGIVVVEGATPVAYEESGSSSVARWVLPRDENGLSRADYTFTGNVLGFLQALNTATGSMHIVRPLMSAPWAEYEGLSRGDQQVRIVSQTITEGLTGMQVADRERSAVANVYRMQGTDIEVVRADNTSVARYGQQATDVNAGGLYGETNTPAAVGDFYLTRDREVRLRPVVEMTNNWPTQLIRQPGDLIVLTASRLGIYSQRFIIAAVRLSANAETAVWTSTWNLEEWPF